MKLSILAALLPIFYPVIHGAVLARRDPLEGYRIRELEWEIEVSPGVNIMARGTIQQAHEEARKINPNWDADREERIKARRALEKEESPSSLSKRDVDFDKDGRVECGHWERCPTFRIRDGITYLEDVDGRPTEGPGPGECGRVSCSWDSAIWWCNDTRDTKSLRSFKDIAIGAQAIIGQCSFLEPGYKDVVSGQAFHNTNWNVIVRKDSC